MTVVSSKEFATHQRKYYGLAMNDEVCIKRGRNMFRLMPQPAAEEPLTIFEPDADFYRSIPMEEVRDSIVEYMRKKYVEKR